jgi:diguanylate cyclase
LETLRLGNDNAETDASASTSIGIAVCPDDATDRQTLLSHADTALYRAKSEGRGTYRFFEAEMAAAVRNAGCSNTTCAMQSRAASSASYVSHRKMS